MKKAARWWGRAAWLLLDACLTRAEIPPRSSLPGSAGPFGDKGTPTEYSASLKCAIERGWLEIHDSGTFVKFTAAGADLFAWWRRAQAEEKITDDRISAYFHGRAQVFRALERAFA
jgi:hypothetical protein